MNRARNDNVDRNNDTLRREERKKVWNDKVKGKIEVNFVMSVKGVSDRTEGSKSCSSVY